MIARIAKVVMINDDEPAFLKIEVSDSSIFGTVRATVSVAISRCDASRIEKLYKIVKEATEKMESE